MIVIFLDIDGVLLPFGGEDRDETTASTCGAHFPDDTMAAFSHILSAYPTAKIVLSSTWRVGLAERQIILQSFKAYGCKFGGPLRVHEQQFCHDFFDVTDPLFHYERQHEIFKWLHENQQHSALDAWIALDDEELLEGEANAVNRSTFEGHVVKTESAKGLTMRDAQEAVRLVNQQLLRL